ncbi:hypothetical protein ABER68_04235 [Paenibacillus alvei]
MREIKAMFNDSENYDYDEYQVKVMSPSIILSWEDGREWAFRILEEEISYQQKEVAIDRDNCVGVTISLEGIEGVKLTAEFLAKASFVEVIHALGNKRPNDGGTSLGRR